MLASLPAHMAHIGSSYASSRLAHAATAATAAGLLHLTSGAGLAAGSELKRRCDATQFHFCLGPLLAAAGFWNWNLCGGSGVAATVLLQNT